MKKFIMSLLFLALVACTPSSTEELKSTRVDTTFQMHVIVVQPEQITQVCSTLGVEYKANGCSKFDLDKKICTIYVMPQRFVQDEERLVIIGHETWHCVFGKWHQ